MKITRNIRAQIGIIGIIMIPIMLVILSAMMPLMVDRIENVSAQVDTTTGLMLDLIPLVLVVAIIVSAILYIVPMWTRSTM